MGVFDNEIKIIDRLPKVIDETVKNAVTKYGFVIKNYNIVNQLDEKGENSLGKKLDYKLPKKGYSNPYKRVRIKAGLQVQYVDTHFTGKFHASIQIVAEDGQFKITSDIDYGEHVIRRYGKEMLGIQKQYLQDFVDKYLIEELKNAVNGHFTKS
ncbi:hypothetical protein PL373_13600 [Tenacibaculum maritimum]|nr:hypothetical protein [Tenacibaculum maritimum]MDB0602164.1 hypothetical protein [Tenacibaculum maritimum]MDB0613840.1 hypothetical protein [Tenacibaculum maritimum]